MSLPNEFATEDERYLASVERTLAAAAIPPSKLGPARRARRDARPTYQRALACPS